MQKSLKALLRTLLNKKKGRVHSPENKMIKSKIKWLPKKEQKVFWKEYKKLINECIILRSKKRTGKGSDWHISLNSRKIKEAYLLLD